MVTDAQLLTNRDAAALENAARTLKRVREGSTEFEPIPLREILDDRDRIEYRDEIRGSGSTSFAEFGDPS